MIEPAEKPPDQVLYVKAYQFHVLIVSFWPFWRTNGAQGWWKWSTKFTLSEPSHLVGNWGHTKTQCPYTSSLRGNECYEPSEVIDGYIREATSWAEHLLVNCGHGVPRPW